MILYLSLLFGLHVVQANLLSQLNPSASSDILQKKTTPETFLATYTNHSFASSFILSLYQNLTKGMPLNQATGRPEHWRDLKYTDTVRSFPSIGSLQLQNHVIYKFNMSAMSPAEKLRVAELRLKLPSSWQQYQQFYATATTITERWKVTYASSVSIAVPHFAADGIQTVDITLIATEWLEHTKSASPTNDFTMDIVLSGIHQQKPNTRSKYLRHLERMFTNENPRFVIHESSDALLVAYTEVGDFTRETKRRATTVDGEDILELVTEDYDSNEDINETNSTDGHTRLKRAPRRTNVSNYPNESLCRRKDMEIDFMDIGWGEWVVYPTQFNAYQCNGRCSGYADSRSNPTNHAIVKSLVRLVGRDTIPVSCCTPSKLSPLSILYLEKGSVVIKHHEDMIVDECGCM